MKKIKIEVFIISILWITTIISLILGDYINIFFTIGIVGLSLITLSIKKFYSYSSYALMLLLLFSVFKLVQFSSITLNVGFFGLQLNALSLILLSILLYKKRIIVSNWFRKEDSEEEKKDNYNRKVIFFKKEFQILSNLELVNKLENEVLVNEAIQAINIILEERKS